VKTGKNEKEGDWKIIGFFKKYFFWWTTEIWERCSQRGTKEIWSRVGFMQKNRFEWGQILT